MENYIINTDVDKIKSPIESLKNVLSSHKLQLLTTTFDKNLRCLVLSMINKDLLNDRDLENILTVDNIYNDELTIFAHNLRDFDGYFLYKGLLNYYPVKDVNCLIDESNSFISINLKHGFKIEWKDS